MEDQPRRKIQIGNFDYSRPSVGTGRDLSLRPIKQKIFYLKQTKQIDLYLPQPTGLWTI
jgi:hypothetical protein